MSSNIFFRAPGYGFIPCADWLRRYSATVVPNGAHFWHKDGDAVWWQFEHEYGWGIFWCGSWMTRDRPSFLFLRRAMRLRRGLYTQ